MSKRPDLKVHKDSCKNFLSGFTHKRKKKYIKMMQEVANRERFTIPIELDDLETFGNNEDLIEYIEKNTLRYIDVFSEAIDELLPSPDENVILQDDVIDCIISSRKQCLQSRERQENFDNDRESSLDQNINNIGYIHDKTGIPKQLLRRYEVNIIPRSTKKMKKIREIGAGNIGNLITVQGIITRITNVKPLMRVQTYVCHICGNEIYQTINKKTYTPLSECPSEECKRNHNKRPIQPITRGSKFVRFQEMKLQESPEEVPEGNVPRSMTVYIMGNDNTRMGTCGDKVKVSGIWLPFPNNLSFGFKGRDAVGLVTNTYLLCQEMVKEKKDFKNDLKDINKKMQKQLIKMGKDKEIYDKLANSIAPEIYGLEDVKKALLLLLVSGVTKEQRDGMKIRGDINILLMGDPGVAKSQLLKHIGTIAPRCVYTTGKGSSGVGLTASVLRDDTTKDMVLEGGALVLSDMGICCIDEFDKMEESDRTAIHEVMEQQTISIAKAGITCTLNARTSILAAANPAYGRYDKKRSPEININLPAALLSRFDLVFVLVDHADPENDLNLAKHITRVHQLSKHPELDFEPFDPNTLRHYINKAKTFNPVIPRELTKFISSNYVEMRKNCLNDQGQYDSRKIIATPRKLLSILRLSQALARLRFSNNVQQNDIEEAIRLMREAQKSTLEDKEILRENQDLVSRIYQNIIQYVQKHDIQGTGQIRLSSLKEHLTTVGYMNNDINNCLDAYEENNIWSVSEDGEILIINA